MVRRLVERLTIENIKSKIANSKFSICDLIFAVYYFDSGSYAPSCIIRAGDALTTNCPGSEKTLSQDVTNCPRCQRRTPAARGDCIYCGEHLPFVSIQSAPPQRNIDPAEHAFNTVLQPFPARINESIVTALASALQIEVSEAQALIDAASPSPWREAKLVRKPT